MIEILDTFCFVLSGTPFSSAWTAFLWKILVSLSNFQLYVFGLGNSLIETLSFCNNSHLILSILANAMEYVVMEQCSAFVWNNFMLKTLTMNRNREKSFHSRITSWFKLNAPGNRCLCKCACSVCWIHFQLTWKSLTDLFIYFLPGWQQLDLSQLQISILWWTIWKLNLMELF